MDMNFDSNEQFAHPKKLHNEDKARIEKKTAAEYNQQCCAIEVNRIILFHSKSDS